MNVIWTNNAKRELRGVYDYVAKNSPRYAQGVVDRITRKTEQLATFPRFGAEVPEYGTSRSESWWSIRTESSTGSVTIVSRYCRWCMEPGNCLLTFQETPS